MKDVLKRFTSPVVLGGLFTIIVTLSGISPENMTSWELLFENMLTIFTNPFVLFSIIFQIFAFLNNPTSRDSF